MNKKLDNFIDEVVDEVFDELDFGYTPQSKFAKTASIVLTIIPIIVSLVAITISIIGLVQR